ncbi:MAG: electron transfer flavoprotein subunit beta [Desulfuromonadales bacterium]|nr:electron transfer flavoprotein subunit beta [Actinomycetota bacterium]MDZ4184840.1 electron transfer flavoprotein subunit beta [Desulfuromonadales bacterium]
MNDKPLKIVVLLRETCDPRPPVQLTADGYSVSERGLRRIANPADLAALEQALRLAEAHRGEVIAVAIGPQRLDNHLRIALAMGAGRAIRVWNSAFAGGDVVSAARLSGRILEILAPDLILTGSRLLDRGDDPTLALAAARLDIPCLSATVELRHHERGVEALRKCDRGARQKVIAALPCALLIEADSCTPRYPDQPGLMAALAAPLELWGLPELGLPASAIGAAAALLGKGPCAFPRPNPQRTVTPDANLPAFERILALLSGGIKPRAGKLQTLECEATVERLLEIFTNAGLIGSESS